MEQSKNHIGGTRTIILNGAGKVSNWGGKTRLATFAGQHSDMGINTNTANLRRTGIKQCNQNSKGKWGKHKSDRVNNSNTIQEQDMWNKTYTSKWGRIRLTQEEDV